MQPPEHDMWEVQMDCAAVRLIADIKKKHKTIELLTEHKMWVGGKKRASSISECPLGANIFKLTYRNQQNSIRAPEATKSQAL